MTASPVMREIWIIGAALSATARAGEAYLVPRWVVGEFPVRAAVGGDCLRVPDDPPWPCGQTGCL
jgi:hypothetical protein